jgi:hypothetical protein
MMRYFFFGAQRVAREQQHRAGDGRLADRRLVVVLDGGDLRARQLALEGGVGPLDLADEGGHLVVVARLFGREAAFSLGVEARDEADALEQILGRVSGEIEDAVLLAYLGREHEVPRT